MLLMFDLLCCYFFLGFGREFSRLRRRDVLTAAVNGFTFSVYRCNRRQRRRGRRLTLKT